LTPDIITFAAGKTNPTGMNHYAAFIRGINVGGVVLKMDKLKEIFTGLGFAGVETYIQSGNVIFGTTEQDENALEARISNQIRIETGLDVAVLVRSKKEMEQITAVHPFWNMDNKKGLYITLLKDTPPEGHSLSKTDAANEMFLLKGRTIFSYYGDGYGRSKHDNNYFERIWKIPATTRNRNTAIKIADILRKRQDKGAPALI